MAAVKTEDLESSKNGENEQDSGNEIEDLNENNLAATKKKRKKKKKKPVGKFHRFYNYSRAWSCNFFLDENNITENTEQINEIPENVPDNEADNEEVEGDKKKKKRNRKKGGGKTQELVAPQIPIVEQFPAGVFPIGEIQQYLPSKDDRTAKDRFTNEEKRALDRMHNDIYNEVRLAAEAHRQV